MSTPVRVAGYLAGLVALFAAAFGLGTVIAPPSAADGHGHRQATSGTSAGHDASGGHSGAEPRSAHDSDHGSGAESGTAGPMSLPGGLQVAQDGYRLAPLSTELPTAEATDFRFQIIGPDGLPVRAYLPTHEKELHLVVVRRDLAGFQHVHPERSADGTWTVPLRVAAPGQYRVFADFQPVRLSEPLTLGVDVPAAGGYQPVALPQPTRTATVDGYTVTLAGDLTAGTSSRLDLTVSRPDGTPVDDLQPYLGAYGHLVALRAGDLAYLHVHPDGAPGDGKTAPGPRISFHAEVPSAGSYRLYLDFQHAGTVRTAEFTMLAGQAHN